MRRRGTAFLTLLAVGTMTVAHAADSPASVMILGTFHFDQPGLDLINVGAGDVLDARRQAEIESVVERLAAYAPTRIALELLPEDADRFNARYQAWRRGEAELTANERDQLGMRLAARLGHERLYAVDYRPLGMDFDAMMAAGQAAGQSPLMAALQQDFRAIEETLEREQDPDQTIAEMLAFHNGPWVEAGNALYLRMAQLGSDEAPTGADVIADWYSRNLHIYANVARLAQDAGERILVIYGSGHRDHLTDFFEESPDFTLVSPLEYLQERP
jgi:Family of unknown function (DUF5694)